MIEALVVSFYIAFVEWVIRNTITKRFEKEVKYAMSLKKALAMRRTYYVIRIIVVLFFYALLACAYMFFLESKLGSLEASSYVIIFIIMFLYVSNIGDLTRIIGSVGLESYRDYLKKHKEFSLYLRSFSVDNYSYGKALRNNVCDEFLIMKNLTNYMPACAVGMTKELHAPWGADRVYISDEEWRIGVRELIERSRLIVILINNKPNCLWEIEQCLDSLDKTIFIIDDLDKYEQVREAVKDRVKLPNLTSAHQNQIFSIYFEKEGSTEENYSVKVLRMINEHKYYKKYVQIIAKAKLTQKYKSRQVHNIILYAILTFLMLFAFCFSYFGGLTIFRG